jgi:ABC-type glycerol-3-phosphate transport system substrate-binding protein
VVELPRRKRQATTTFAVAYSVAKQTRQPEKAWELVKFLTSRKAQDGVANSAQAIPSRRSAATGPAFEHPSAFADIDYPIASRPHTDSVAYGRYGPRFLTASKAKDHFSREVEALWTSPDPARRDAKKILKRIQPELEDIVAGREAK